MSGLRYTCSLCSHLDANRGECKLLNINTYPQNASEANSCKANGHFIRDLNVQLSYFNFVDENDNFSSDFIEDLSKLPKDNSRIPLFVLTKKGIERAVPAYSGLELQSNHLMGVKREFTYQGQRELIYEIGVTLARKVCAGSGVKLHVLDGEENVTGIEELKIPYLVYGR